MKILLFVTAINFVFLFYSHNYLETFGIIASIIVAVAVSTVSEVGSENAFAKLQKITNEIKSRVIRNGKTVVLPSAEIVVGDIILLGSGDKVPADGVMTDGEIAADQSVLNGESRECKKAVCTGGGDKEGLFSPCLVFAGTVVTGGIGIMRVTRVGESTEYGKIAKGLNDEPPTSPLKVKLSKLAKLISVIGYVGAFIAAGTYLMSVCEDGITFAEILAAATLVVSVIVMAVPEGLPMMITVVLSSNMRAMMKDNLLVRKLNAVETAGSLNMLFTDKTGTITAGKLTVCGVLLPNGEYIEDDFANRLGGLGKLLGAALVLNNEAEYSVGTFIGGNITDRAVAEFGMRLLDGKKPPETKAKTIPFSSATKFMATEMESGEIYYKGAVEVILPNCTLPDRDRERLRFRVAELNARSVRVLCVAAGDVLLGFIAIADEVRKEAKASIEELHDAKIQVVLITGDSRETAVAVAKEVGIICGSFQASRLKGQDRILPNKVNIAAVLTRFETIERTSGRTQNPEHYREIVLTSDELDKLTDDELREILPDLRVVARAYPNDKSRLVRVAQSLNLVVGMTGDGVNDAPALKKAELGFAMGSGTEVAKAAGDIVIVDDNIKSITRAVSFGRTLFESIRKFLVFKLTINFIAMAICIIAPLIGTSSPITVVQMLWINLVMDTLAGLAFGGEKPRAEYMLDFPKRRDENLITKHMWHKILWGSVFGILICLWFLTSPYIQNIVTDEKTFATVFFTFFMFLNICNAFNARTERVNIFSGIGKNKAFIIVMVLIAVSQFAIIYYGGTVFRTIPISLRYLSLATVLSTLIVPAEMLRKVLVK